MPRERQCLCEPDRRELEWRRNKGAPSWQEKYRDETIYLSEYSRFTGSFKAARAGYGVARRLPFPKGPRMDPNRGTLDRRPRGRRPGTGCARPCGKHNQPARSPVVAPNMQIYGRGMVAVAVWWHLILRHIEAPPYIFRLLPLRR